MNPRLDMPRPLYTLQLSYVRPRPRLRMLLSSLVLALVLWLVLWELARLAL